MNADDFQIRRQAQLQAENRRRAEAGQAPLALGGRPPDDPGMEPRVAALEADMKDVKGSLSRIETTLAVVAETVKHLTTKAELNTVTGSVTTLSVKVDGLATRLDRVETNVGTALTTAVGKAIGPMQFVSIIASSGAIVVVSAALVAWIVGHFFPHALN